MLKMAENSGSWKLKQKYLQKESAIKKTGKNNVLITQPLRRA